jgi:hypothetical protein
MAPDHSYVIRYLGYEIAYRSGVLVIALPKGADETSPVENQRYAPNNLVATNGDISVNGQKLVEGGRALCYSVSISKWTLTRHAGSGIINIVGPGVRSPMQWDAPFHVECPGLPRIHMIKGDVRVGNRLVIKGGRLHDGESDVSEEPVEEPVEETRRPSRNDVVVTPRTHAQIQDTGLPTASYAPEDLGQRIFQLVHGVHTVDRYPHCFIYNNPSTWTYSAKINLSASSSGSSYLFLEGSVWLDGEEVIRDGSQLPEGHPARPQPHFDIFSD